MVFPDSHKVSRVLRYSRSHAAWISLRLRDWHPLWSTFPDRLASYTSSLSVTATTAHMSHDPLITTLAGLHNQGLGCSPFARHYLGYRYYFLFLQVLRCFSSLSLLPKVYVFNQRMYQHHLIRVFPFRNLRITACVTAPHSLSQLPTSFIASNRQGIHRIPLVACLLLYPETPDFMLIFATSANILKF